MISVLQLKRRLTQEELTFMTIPMVQEVTTVEPVPNEIRDVLHSYADIKLESLSKTLPPHGDINHKIELLHGV